MLKSKMNKKGQFESVILAVISIFIIGIVLFFSNHVVDQIYSGFNKTLSTSSATEDSLAISTINRIQKVENSVWDFAFLAMFMGLIFQIVLFSFATRVNIAFFWIMVIVDIPILLVGVILSNIWQEMVSKPEFATTITRFPITDLILGTYFPIAIVVILFFAAIALFGKPPIEQSEQ